MTTIPRVTKMLLQLAEKPREQIAILDLATAGALRKRGLATCTQISSLKEQNIWTITSLGLQWLSRHGLLDANNPD